MPIDPSIALQVRPLEVPNQLGQFAQMSQIQNAQNQNALAQYQLAAAQRAENVQNALNQQYTKAYNPQTGEIDVNLLRGGLAQAGVGSQIPAIEKALGELEQQKLTRQKLSGEIAASRTAQFRDLLGNITDAGTAKQWLAAQYSDPVLGPIVSRVPLEQAVAQIPTDPKEFNLWKTKNTLGMAEFIKQNKPTVNVQDRGATSVTRMISPLTGEIQTLETAPKTMSPYETQHLKIQQGQFNLAQQKFDWEKANPGYELKEDADGNFYGVNKRTLQATPVTIGAPAVMPGAPSGAAPGVPGAPVAGTVPNAPAATPTAAPTTTPLKGKGQALTEAQGNATAFGMRMTEANKLLTDLENQKVTSGGRIKGAVEGTLTSLVPYMGEKLAEGAGAVMNVLPSVMGGPSGEQQQYNQAKLNFITAILRKESGAAIGASEFANEEKKYFPQAGDTESVLKQKQRARELAIDAMKIQAGPGAKNIQSTGGWSVVR